jgi:hypothetical protein
MRCKNRDLIWVEPAQMKDAHHLVLQLVGARILSYEVKLAPSSGGNYCLSVFLNWLLVIDPNAVSDGVARRKAMAYIQDSRWHSFLTQRI